MEKGRIVEYIDRQKIVCAVVLDERDKRARLLTEANREETLSPNRFIHISREGTDVSQGRDALTGMLKAISNRRSSLVDSIDVKELWEVLNTEREWIDLETMTAFCFPNEPTDDNEAAVNRAFFRNRLYFKFDRRQFFPYSEEQVEQLLERKKEEERRREMIDAGSKWLERIKTQPGKAISADGTPFVDIVKSLYLFGKDSTEYDIGKEMLSNAGIKDSDHIFQILVDLGVFCEDENVDLLKLRLPVRFPEPVRSQADHLLSTIDTVSANGLRKDMTALSLMTIDGQGTMDYDDAISIEKRGEHYFLGIHIIDVGHFVKKDDPIDYEACARGSSIYMPDSKIPMLPPQLAEGVCSLKAGQIKPAISIMTKLTPTADVLDFEVVPSIVRVRKQLTYYDVNMMADENPDILILRDIAHHLRKNRLSKGAVQISLPDINVVLDGNGEIIVSTVNRDSPARVIVEELMILANGLMARFLSEHGVPAVFRSQPEPRERLYKGNNGTLFQNYSQRKLLSRFILGNKPERHAGLGMDAYVTATSPIRKYFDLVTQRQIRAIFDMERPYTAEELDRLFQILEQPMANVMAVQMRRKRYWLLKYLEGKIGEKYQAIVLYKRRDNYQILIPDFMLECTIAVSAGLSLSREDVIRVTLQHVNARNSSISVFWA